MAAECPAAEVQVEAGKKHSPIVQAIIMAEAETTGEIRVHLSKRFLEKDPYVRALKLFSKFGMHRTSHRNGVLLYVNLRKKKFAIVGDEGVHKAVGQKYWEELVHALKQDLRGTHPEIAISLAVRTIGFTLQKFFPLEKGENHVETDDTVSEDR